MTTEAKVHAIFAALDRAGISITDFHRLTSISRTSLHSWRRGGTVTDMIRLRDAYAFAQRIDKAVELKKLPLVGTYRISERLRVLRGIIAEANKEMGR